MLGAVVEMTVEFLDCVPTIGIVIPTYNRSSLLERALKSVLSQDYPGITGICVTDDGSSDDTERVVRSFMAIDPRITYVKNEKYRRGPAGNKNNGLDWLEYDLRPELYAFVDDDWELLPGALSTLVEAYLETGRRYDFVFGDAVDEFGNKVTYVEEGLVDVGYEDVLCGRCANDGFGIARTSSLRGRRFFDDCWGGEWTLWAQILKDGARGLYVDRPLMRLRTQGERVTFKVVGFPERQFLNYVRYLEIVEEDLRRLCPKMLAKHALSAALFAKLAGMGEEKAMYLKKAISSYPSPSVLLVSAAILFLPNFVLSRLRGGYLYLRIRERLLKMLRF